MGPGLLLTGRAVAGVHPNGPPITRRVVRIRFAGNLIPDYFGTLWTAPVDWSLHGKFCRLRASSTFPTRSIRRGGSAVPTRTLLVFKCQPS